MATPDRERLVCPTDETIAFAISIVQSKPTELTVQAYIDLLKQHIARGRRENSLSNVYRHLDRSSYWRSEYERTRDLLRVAEEERVDLQRKIEEMKSNAESIKPGSPTKKRKKQDTDIIPVPRSPKKARREVSPARMTLAVVEASTDVAFSHAGEIGDLLLRCLFHIHTHLKRSQKTNSDELAYHIVRATSVLPQLVQHEIEKIITERAAINEDLRNVLTVTARAVASIFAGCNRLSHVQNAAAVRGRAIYAVVHMFKSLIDTFDLLSAKEVEKTVLPDAAPASTTSPTKTKSKAKPKTIKPPNIKENPTLSLYAHFLASIIDKLDAKIETNKDLFEGFAYCIIRKLGNRLYSSVFGHARASDMETEIQQSAQVNDIDDGSQHPPSREQKQIRLEAPYLVHLLNRIMVAAPKYLGAMQGRSSKAKQGTKASLAISAQETLQRTLINCTFGTEGDDKEDLFKECLQMPVASGGKLPIPKVKEADLQDWFKEEVWRVVGWDILAKEDGW